MHEASLMANLLHRVEEIARAQNAQRVVGVSVWLGALSHMSDAHFVEHFERAAIGTVAEGAQLDVTVSTDTGHANALDLVLQSVEVEA